MRFSPRLLPVALGLIGLPLSEPVRTNPPASGVSVSGFLYDSVARVPLARAAVQLVDADSLIRFTRTVESDSLGRFVFTDVPAGRYVLGFLHAKLDSLGLEPIMREVRVGDERNVRADLAIPPAARLRALICGPKSEPDAGAVLMGFVNNAQQRTPVGGVSVSAEWMEYAISNVGVVPRHVRRVTTTRESGWFALCDVPSPGTLQLQATRGTDSTDVVEMQVVRGAFARRDLYLGVARLVADSVAPPDSPGRRLHVGDGRLSGTVTAAKDGRPLAGAQVGIVGGAQVRANARGEWTLTDAPSGTRTLETRAVGFYPERQIVDVVDGAANVRVAMATLSSVLETMKVVSTRNRMENMRAFQQRSRTGPGRFLNAQDIARHQPLLTSELFLAMPGVYLEVNPDTTGSLAGVMRTSDDNAATSPEVVIVMRGTFSHRCIPAIFFNGLSMMYLTARDVDSFMSPNEIAGIEVYTAEQAPTQFANLVKGCGSIAFWTR